MAQEELASTKVAGLLVDQRDLGATQAVCSVGAGFETDHRNPTIDQAGVLTSTNVITRAAAAGKQPIVWARATKCQPSLQRLCCRLGYLERYRSAGLLLITVARGLSDPPGATSLTRSLTRSQPRSFASIAQSNSARSRVRLDVLRCSRMAQTCFGLNGGLGPIILRAFHGVRGVRNRSR